MTTSKDPKHTRLKTKFRLTADQRHLLAPLFAQVEEHNKTDLGTGQGIAIFAQVYRDGCVAITVNPHEVSIIQGALRTTSANRRAYAFDDLDSLPEDPQ